MINFIEYTDRYKPDTIELIIQILVEEYGFYEFKKSIEKTDFNQYKKKGGKLWLAINEDNEVVGSIAVHRKSRHTVKLEKVYVKKEYRKNGIAKMLWNLALQYAIEKEYEKMTVATYENMKTAVAFYKKNGFIECENVRKRVKDEKHFCLSLHM